MEYLTLNDNAKMPILGLGTWRASDEEVEFAVNEALEAGYRHIDTAPVYLNEKAIGRTLRKWFDEGKVKREDLFIVTKLPPTANRPHQVEATIKNSLADLQLDYVDMYLVHAPFTWCSENGDLKFVNGRLQVDPSTDHLAVWKEMEALVEKGLTKSIGVSNFNVKQLERLLANCSIKPANLQIEHHVYLQQPELVNYCKEQEIAVTAYSPLGSRGIAQLHKSAGIDRELPDLMDIKEVKEIAAKYEVTPAQVLLRWIVQRGIAAIPKSANAKRLRDNIDIIRFALTDDEMVTLNGLDANVRVCDFKFFPGADEHPEFPF